MDDTLDVIVIGAGIVGLAVARALALRGRAVLVLERHALPVQETSSRNSGVIHSGIYYPTDSLKARLCVDGRQRLYEFVELKGVAHQRCGKLIVAQEGQQTALEALRLHGLRNGVMDLAPLTAAEVRDLEPEVRCAAGLWCPSTGIVDAHDLAQSLIAELESAGGTIAYRTVVQSAVVGTGRARLNCRSGDEYIALECELVVNAAGLDAVGLLSCFEGYPKSLLRKAWYAKGNYFSLAGAKPFRHLVYPMPNEAGLGIHATLDLDGAVRFGPNVAWVDNPDYAVDPRDAAEFYGSIRSYWPNLADGALHPAYAGVRPKLVGAGEKAADFVIEGPGTHGCAGLVNLLGIESPGLTSCLAIGEYLTSLDETNLFHPPQDAQ
jgi:L-2-hydroxyglutarate oxidase LhgO